MSDKPLSLKGIAEMQKYIKDNPSGAPTHVVFSPADIAKFQEIGGFNKPEKHIVVVGVEL